MIEAIYLQSPIDAAIGISFKTNLPRLEWITDGTDPLGVSIWFGESEDVWTVIKSDEMGLFFDIPFYLKMTTVYYWKVVANSNSVPSEIYTFTTGFDNIVLDEPLGGGAPISIYTSFNWHSDNIEELDYILVFNDEDLGVQSSGFTLPYDLDYSTDYHWYITELGPAGDYFNCTTVYFTTEAIPLPTVTNLVTSNITFGGFYCSWESTYSNSFDVYSVREGEQPEIQGYTADNIIPVILDLDFGKTYNWFVIAHGDGGDVQSEYKEFSTVLPTVTSLTPIDSAISVSINPQLVWETTDLDSTCYISVWFGLVDNMIEIPYLLYNTTTYNTDLLDYATSYQWKIVCHSPKNEVLLESATFTFTTISEPIPINNFSSPPQRDGVSVTSTINIVNLIAKLEDDYFNEADKFLEVYIYYMHEDGVQKKKIKHEGAELTGDVFWTTNAHSGVWQKTKVIAIDTDGATKEIDRAVIGTGEDLTLS
jgi:hypothetical protein